MSRGAFACAVVIACAPACTSEEIELPQAPNAFAGFDSFVALGSSAALDASLSTDPDGDALGFSWRIAAAPEGSTARIADASARVTSIVPDLRGTWVVSLTVFDGKLSARDLVAFTATASTATAARPRIALLPTSRNASLSMTPIALSAESDGLVEPYVIRVPAGASPDDLSLMTAGQEIGFIAPRPGEYWIAAVARNDQSVSPPAIATVRVFEDALEHPRAVLEAPATAHKNDRVLFDGRATEGAAAMTWRFVADPSNGADSLSDVATGCPAGMCRLWLPSKIGLYVVALEIEGGVTAVHAVEVEE